MSFESGLCSVTFRALDPEQVLVLARDARLSAIEWGADVHLPVGDRERARVLRERCGLEGVSASSYGSYVFAGADTGQSFDDALATAVALGASSLRVWAGEMGASSADRPAEAWNRCAEALRAMAERASEQSVAISVEYHPGTLTDALDSALRLFEVTAHENVFTHWQPRPGLEPERAVVEVEALLPYLSHLHVFSWGDGGKRHPLSAGEALWRPVLERAGACHNGWRGQRVAWLEFVAEDSIESFSRDAEQLHAWLAAS